MAGSSPDLIVRVAANISALQSDMATAAASIKGIETAVTGAGHATGGFVGWLDEMGHSFVARVAEGILLRDAVRELINFGKEAVVETARIEDLAKATGMSTDAIQRFTYVSKEFGVETDQMVRGVEQLSAKLANGDANATRAVQALGLSVKDLIASGPEEAFLSIAEAVGRVEDPMMKNGLATELFGGKIGKTLIPMLAELRTKMEEVPKDAIITEAQVKAAHDFEVGLEHLIIRAKAWTVVVAEAVGGYLSMLGETAELIKQGHFFSTTLDETATAQRKDIELKKDAISAATLLANRLQALRTEAMDPLSDKQKGSIVELEKYGVSHKEIAQLVGTTEIAIKRYTDSLIEQEQAVKAVVAEIKKWDELLVHLDKETFTLAMEHQKQWRGEQATRATIATDAIVAEFEAQVKLNAAVGLDAAGAIKVQGTALETLRLALHALHLKKEEALAQGVVIVSQEKEEQVLMNAYTKQVYDEALAQDRLAGTLAVTTKGYYAQIDALAALMGLTSVGARANAPGTGVNQGANERGDKINQGDTVPINGINASTVPSFKLPGFSLTGGGSSGGSSVTHVYNITQPLGTPEAIAAAVDEALMARQRNTGQRF